MSEKHSKPNWSTIADDIEEGAAVLLLGPDAFRLRNVSADPSKEDLKEITYRDLYRIRIEKNADIDLKSFYKPDHFFLFQDNNSKKKAKRAVSALAKDVIWQPDEDLLTKIAAISFPMVISVNPDLYLHQMLERYGVRHQYDYYSVLENKAEKTLEEPANNYPLIYNLCGSVEDPNSLILDYYDLFRLMKNLLSETKFPQKLKFALKNATTYIFLGFQFDRWYSQMMLHYLNMLDSEFDNSSNNYSMFSEVSSEDTQKFIVKQFNIQYIGADESDFDQLYETCRQRGLLRDLPNPYSEQATAIRMKVAADDLHGALSMLENNQSNNENFDVITLLISRLSQWQKQQTQKTVSAEDLNLERNQIRYAILDLANQLK